MSSAAEIFLGAHVGGWGTWLVIKCVPSFRRYAMPWYVEELVCLATFGVMVAIQAIK